MSRGETCPRKVTVGLSRGETCPRKVTVGTYPGGEKCLGNVTVGVHPARKNMPWESNRGITSQGETCPGKVTVGIHPAGVTRHRITLPCLVLQRSSCDGLYSNVAFLFIVLRHYRLLRLLDGNPTCGSLFIQFPSPP